MRDHPDPVMIFAAGFGTRMGALTADRPKPLIEVAGRPLIDHAIGQARAYGAGRIVVNLHYKAELLRRHLAGSGILLSEEQPEILDTGGGLRAALPLLGPNPVFTMNSDALWAGPNPLKYLAEHWAPDAMEALLLCVPPDRALGHAGPGDFEIGENGRARRGAGTIYSGLQILHTDGLAEIDGAVFSLNRLWNRVAARGGLFAVNYPGKWCDVGRPEGIELAEDMLQSDDV